jgi:hypothetical protein
MNAIGAQLGREVGPIIDQHRDAAILRTRNDLAPQFEDMAVRRGNAGARLQPDLQRRDISAIQRLFKLPRANAAISANFRRRDQIETAAAR